jgi:hypothetical protein
VLALALLTLFGRLGLSSCLGLLARLGLLSLLGRLSGRLRPGRG